MHASPALNLKDMSGAAFIVQEISQLYSLPQWCKRLFLPVPICQNTETMKIPPMCTVRLHFVIRCYQIWSVQCWLKPFWSSSQIDLIYTDWHYCLLNQSEPTICDWLNIGHLGWYCFFFFSEHSKLAMLSYNLFNPFYTICTRKQWFVKLKSEVPGFSANHCLRLTQIICKKLCCIHRWLYREAVLNLLPLPPSPHHHHH